MIKIQHQKRFDTRTSAVYKGIASLDDLDASILQVGLEHGSKDTDEYKTFAGAAYEVYCEFFCKKYGSTPVLGINNVLDTSLDPFNEGFDFSFLAQDGKRGMLQSKWKSNPVYKFKRAKLAMFLAVLREDNISPSNSILFTNLRHTPTKENGSIFHFSWDKATTQMRVVDRTAQEQFILRDPEFWNELRASVEQSCEFTCVPVPVNENHQDEMERASNRVIDGEFRRGIVVCATGGGKTLIEYRNIRRVLFDLGKRLTIIVAPTRDLVDQHFTTFHNYGLFHDGIKAINFKSGSEPRRDDDGVDFCQTTRENELIPALQDVDKIHICSTYKSFPILVETLVKNNIVIDLIIFDEFQHLVQQSVNDFGISDMRSFLHSLLCERVLCYSASLKRGRILNSFDQKIFGPILCNIPYKRLRENGILVPKLHIIPVRVTPSRIEGLTRSMKDQMALYKNVDLEDVLIEAAGMIVAYEHAKTQNPHANMITWGKKVSHLKMIEGSDVVRQRLNDVTIHLVHAGVPTRDRTNIYETIRNSHNNILLQHSCVSEGVNVVNLNTGYVARRLSMIGLQQGPGGRITRTIPEDRKRFKEGKLSLDSPEGWIKYSSTVYILVETEQEETFLNFMRDLIRKLQYAGLTEDDYEFHDLVEERHGDTNASELPMPTIELGHGITSESLEDVIRQAHLDLKEEEEKLELNELKDELKAQSEDCFWEHL